MYIGNEKINKLWKEIHPWMKGAKLSKDAPGKVKAKFEEIKKLADEEEERQIRMML